MHSEGKTTMKISLSLLSLLALLALLFISPPALYALDENQFAIKGNALSLETVQRASDNSYKRITLTLATYGSGALELAPVNCPLSAGSTQAVCLDTFSWFSGFCQTATAQSVGTNSDDGEVEVTTIRICTSGYGRCGRAVGILRAGGPMALTLQTKPTFDCTSK